MDLRKLFRKNADEHEDPQLFVDAPGSKAVDDFTDEEDVRESAERDDNFVPPPSGGFEEVATTKFRPSVDGIIDQINESGRILQIRTRRDDIFASPLCLDDLNLSPSSLQDLMLKFLFYIGDMYGKDLALRMRLPLHGIVDPLLMGLLDDEFVQVLGSTGVGGHNKIYRLTEKGSRRARSALQTSDYVGPAPVPMSDYIESVNRFKLPRFTEEELREAYSDLIIEDDIFANLGPALQSGKSIFIYGPPGTGKTSIAERLTRVFNDTIRVPYAVNIQGTAVRFFDYYLHVPVDPNHKPGQLPPLNTNEDARWVEIRRPLVTVGPEFTLAATGLQYDAGGTSCQFPSMMKANGGVFMIDDFGRQQESPEAMLNRWIIPLEKATDILTFKTGQQVMAPYRAMTVFSTNMNPSALVDEAFLRRIAYKLKIDYPSLDTYCQIFANVAEKYKIDWSDDSLDYFIQAYYFKPKKPLVACEPRDILSRVVDICGYRGMSQPFKLTNELIDQACGMYFITK